VCRKSQRRGTSWVVGPAIANVIDNQNISQWSLSLLTSDVSVSYIPDRLFFWFFLGSGIHMLSLYMVIQSDGIPLNAKKKK
jgi:hypothetical protein